MDLSTSLKIKSFSFNSQQTNDRYRQQLAVDDSSSEENLSGETVEKRISTNRSNSSRQKRSAGRSGKDLNKTENASFVLDTAGDEMNIRYGAVYGVPIPSYRRVGTQILGSNSKYRIQSGKTHERFLLLSKREDKRIKYSQFLQKVTIKVGAQSDLLGDYVLLPKEDQSVNGDAGSVDSEEFHKKSRELNSKVMENPKDFRKWLQLIEFQNKLKSSNSGILEKQLSICEKGLQFLPMNVELWIKYLKIYQKCQRDEEVLGKWDRVLNDFSLDYRIWEEYIEFRLGNFRSFSFTAMVKVFQDCFKSLFEFKNRNADDGEKMLKFFSRLTTFLDQAGYKERAIGLYQGMIEFNCFCPEAYAKLDLEKKRDLFESFWEKELPRFGQDGAPGWENSMFMEASDLEFDQALEPEYIKTDDESHPLQWIKKERFAEFYHWLPQISEEDVEDPYRTVLFEDIQPFLFDLKDRDVIFNLILQFIHFLGVPVTDNTVLNPHLLYTFWKRQDNADLFKFPFSAPNPGFGVFFTDSNWYRTVGEEQLRFIEASGAYKSDFIRNVFEQTRKIHDFKDRVLPFTLTYECASDYKIAHKYSKSILKSEQSNVYLWNSFAHFEQNNSKMNEAKKVYLTALEAFKSVKDSRMGLESVYMSLAELEMLLGNREGSISILTSCIENIWDGYFTASPLRILRAKQEYATQITHLLESKFYENSLECSYYTLCRIYNSLALEYLASENISSVLKQIKNYSEHIQGSFLEKLYELECKFLYHYAISSSGGYKPGLIRESLEELIESFPGNTIFLTMYGWNERRSNFENRVRRILDSKISSSDSLTLRLFFLWSEIHLKSNINVNYITSLFTNCLRECNHPTLWILYIQFEISRDNFSKAKSLYFQAIRSCPWSKEIYLLYDNLESHLDDADFGQVVSVLQDKEIRVRFQP